jgi:hypothetical protein
MEFLTCSLRLPPLPFYEKNGQSQSDNDENETSRTKETWREIETRVVSFVVLPFLNHAWAKKGKGQGKGQICLPQVLSNQDGKE